MDYSYLNQISPQRKPRKRLCTKCLLELNLVSKSKNGTYNITHGICERHFREQMLEIGLTESVISNKVNELKDQYHAMAFCADLNDIL